jgi:maleate isomerase
MALPFTVDAGVADGSGVGGPIGVIVLQTDETLEAELRRAFPDPDTPLYVNRIPSAETVTPETLAQMALDLPAAAALLPSSIPFRAIGYGCTSGSTVIGPERVADLVHSAHPNAQVTNPLTALREACLELGIRRLGFVTPYVEDVTSAMRKALVAGGLEIASVASFEQVEEKVVARITEESVRAAAVAAARRAPCDAVFLSCTNLRAFKIIDAAEAEAGVPVLSSNLVFAWHLARLSGLPAVGLPGSLGQTLAQAAE